jgi:N6-L-threonylcarbamoyladenine synthase
MLVLGIESSCDETSCAIVRNGREILSNVISSQIDLHQHYGGVVPELACRRHVDVMLGVIDQALAEANCSLAAIDLIAVAHGPGLIGALLMGLHTAKGLSIALNKPFIGVNHVEAHLYAAIMSSCEPIAFPCLGVLLSGGHTALVRMEQINDFTLISQTIDDAIGEAFDKVAKMLGLPYPGGPEIEKLACQGTPGRYAFKAGRIKGRPLDFSFSGLKTSVLYTIQGQNCQHHTAIDDAMRSDIAYAFQQAAFSDVINKALLVADREGFSDIIFGGGVTNSRTLRTLFSTAASRCRLHWPTHALSMDNAAMIAGLGFHRYQQQGKSDPLDLQPLTRIPFVKAPS